MHAIVPRAKILVYEALNTHSGLFNLLNKIATDNIASMISMSWGNCEDQVNATYSVSKKKVPTNEVPVIRTQFN
jgi:hypothetical protein